MSNTTRPYFCSGIVHWLWDASLCLNLSIDAGSRSSCNETIRTVHVESGREMRIKAQSPAAAAGSMAGLESPAEGDRVDREGLLLRLRFDEVVTGERDLREDSSHREECRPLDRAS